MAGGGQIVNRTRVDWGIDWGEIFLLLERKNRREKYIYIVLSCLS